MVARAGADAWIVTDGPLVLVGSRMVPEQTTLPLSGLFVPFVSALVNRVARGEVPVLSAAPGAPLTLPGRATALASDSLLPVEGGSVVAAPPVPGVYAVLAGSDTATLLVVAPDPRESDLTRAEPAALRRHFPGARLAFVADARSYAVQRFRGAGRSELTGSLLLLALVVLLVEAAVASGRFSRAA
ncbi:MAG: hypothetical protein A2085_11710 [Gemmatimonadetes bacterium GWC2_71_10]|nr:MAG: hypothetical protein A2085_11710 [Gemmatimonadetes bacterium GWC2_71_10]